MNPELGNRSVAFNSTLVIKCIIRGDHPLHVNWTLNEVDLGNHRNKLIVDYVTFKHAGLYGCTAENWAGTTNTTFWIDVTGKDWLTLETRAVDVMMPRAEGIYILMSKINEGYNSFSLQCFLKAIKDMFSVFLLSYRNTRESLRGLKKAVEILA